MMLDRRRALLTPDSASRSCAGASPCHASRCTLASWIHSWRDVGAVVIGMRAQGYRLHLTCLDDGIWRVSFSRNAMFAAKGFGADRTPWGAVQQAAWTALKNV